MEYNTQRKKMELPEYGRSVQNMVDHALTIEDRAERQRCANTIVNIMGSMFPHLRDVTDFKHKLWDHLAIMADFKLDIDYPFEIVKKEELVMRPERWPIPMALSVIVTMAVSCKNWSGRLSKWKMNRKERPWLDCWPFR